MSSAPDPRCRPPGPLRDIALIVVAVAVAVLLAHVHVDEVRLRWRGSGAISFGRAGHLSIAIDGSSGTPPSVTEPL